MRRTLRTLCLLCAGLLLTALPAQGQDKKADTPEQQKLQKFWADHYEALRRFYQGPEAAQFAAALSKPVPPPVGSAAPCNH